MLLCGDFQEGTHLGAVIDTSVDDSRSRRTEYSDIGSIVGLKVILLGHTTHFIADYLGAVRLPVG